MKTPLDVRNLVEWAYLQVERGGFVLGDDGDFNDVLDCRLEVLANLGAILAHTS
jgi:hypothetical protein